MTLLFGIEKLINSEKLINELKGRKITLLAHPASVDNNLNHSLDLLNNKVKLSSAFGPQHGLKGDKQDNMIESETFIDPKLKIPIFSLYGEVRKPTDEMLKTFDILLVDLQDLGCRIYTFITTLRYILESASKENKTVWVLDRPNPVGREIEGLKLKKGFESFVGAGEIPMKYGLTLGELGFYFIKKLNLNLDYKVIKMENWNPNIPWDLNRSWINPSPNAPNLSMAKCYSGTVLLEGTTLSEGRGTTRPLELFGSPDLDSEKVIKKMFELNEANLKKSKNESWLKGCKLRPCWFEPTFHKYSGKLCSGIQIHVDGDFYNQKEFKPFRLMALALKSIREIYPDYDLWRDFPYEYETEKLAIDVINGSEILRAWVDDSKCGVEELNNLLNKDEIEWRREREEFLIYK